jgi:nucleoid-associated protein YgaU
LIIDIMEGIAMGLMTFIKGAGEKLFGSGASGPASAAGDTPRASPSASADEQIAALGREAGQAIAAHVTAQGLNVEGLQVGFDATNGTVTVSGTVADQATKEKVLLSCGNVNGVSAVDDRLMVSNPAPESKWHTVVSGDTLSRIAKAHYGDPNRYAVIFEANRPMLSHPDKIYPGQVLRIPET